MELLIGKIYKIIIGFRYENENKKTCFGTYIGKYEEVGNIYYLFALPIVDHNINPGIRYNDFVDMSKNSGYSTCLNLIEKYYKLDIPKEAIFYPRTQDCILERVSTKEKYKVLINESYK